MKKFIISFIGWFLAISGFICLIIESFNLFMLIFVPDITLLGAIKAIVFSLLEITGCAIVTLVGCFLALAGHTSKK